MLGGSIMYFKAFVSVIVDYTHYKGNRITVDSDIIKMTGIYPLKIEKKDILRIVNVNRKIFNRNDVIIEYLNGSKINKIRLRFMRKSKLEIFKNILKAEDM